MAEAKAQQPIGIFDSGIGGLTVANAVLKRFPNERIIYFGDTKHLPYGEKSAEAIRYYSKGIADFLIDRGCKMIVIACNSASAAAYRELNKYVPKSIPVLNVIDPVVNAVASDPKIEEVGIIATKATIRSGSYKRKLHKLKSDLKVRGLATPLFVPMIEEGYFNNNISRTIVASYLSKTHLKEIQGLILACTHYPLIRPEIEEYYAGSVQVFDSIDATAAAIQQSLKDSQIASSSKSQNDEFYVSDLTESFQHTTGIFFGKDVHLEKLDIWTKQN